MPLSLGKCPRLSYCDSWLCLIDRIQNQRKELGETPVVVEECRDGGCSQIPFPFDATPLTYTILRF